MKRLLVGLAASLWVVASAHAQEVWQTLPEPPAMPKPAESGMAPVNDIKMYYAVYGEGEPVLLIHGGLGHADVWGFQVPALAEDHKVIVGRQPRPRPQHPLRAAVRLRADGGRLSGPARPSGHRQGRPGRLERWRHHRPRHRDPPPGAAERAVCVRRQRHARGLKETVGNDPVFGAYIERASGDYARLSPTPDEFDAFVKQISQMWATQPHYTKDQLRAITVRTVIFDGDHDEAIKLEHTEEMAELIPNARLEIMKDASHFAMWQQPEAFNASVENFLDGN